MTALARELRAIGAHLADRLEQVVDAPDPAILDFIAAECEGAARVLRRMASEQRKEGEPV